MKKIISALLIWGMLVIPAAAANTDEITPFAFGTYEGSMQLNLNIPEFTSATGKYSVAAWKCPIYIDYRIRYNLNTGEITAVESWNSRIDGRAISPTEQGSLTGLDYEIVTWEIVNNGYSIKCNYQATAHLLYTMFPGVAMYQEYRTVSVNASGTTTPHQS